ncbi:MAG: hypothetical protein JXL67_08725 [Calditrichaeota bacterium]|nr:hypothetical protein [Calditrichota bacterium]
MVREVDSIGFFFAKGLSKQTLTYQTNFFPGESRVISHPDGSFMMVGRSVLEGYQKPEYMYKYKYRFSE